MGPRAHANPVTGAFGVAPTGAPKRVRGVPTWARARMRTLPLEHSAALDAGVGGMRRREDGRRGDEDRDGENGREGEGERA
eukprot:1209313-Pyramimonas_sp.AAC.1